MRHYSQKVIEYFYSKYRGNMQRKPVQIHQRELYENLYLNLSVEANQEIDSDYAGWTPYILLLKINGLLSFLKCQCYTQEEINDISSNMV